MQFKIKHPQPVRAADVRTQTPSALPRPELPLPRRVLCWVGGTALLLIPVSTAAFVLAS